MGHSHWLTTINVPKNHHAHALIRCDNEETLSTQCVVMQFCMLQTKQEWLHAWLDDVEGCSTTHVFMCEMKHPTNNKNGCVISKHNPQTMQQCMHNENVWHHLTQFGPVWSKLGVKQMHMFIFCNEHPNMQKHASVVSQNTSNASQHCMCDNNICHLPLQIGNKHGDLHGCLLVLSDDNVHSCNTMNLSTIADTCVHVCLMQHNNDNSACVFGHSQRVQQVHGHMHVDSWLCLHSNFHARQKADFSRTLNNRSMQTTCKLLRKQCKWWGEVGVSHSECSTSQTMDLWWQSSIHSCAQATVCKNIFGSGFTSPLTISNNDNNC